MSRLRACWQLAIRRARGVEAIVEAMKRHPTHQFVQVHACEALGNLAFVVENRSAIAAAGGIEAVVAALKEHMNSNYVVVAACRVLQNLSLDDKIHPQLMAAGSARAVVSAMDTHCAAQVVQESGCRALCNLSHHNGEGTVASAGGIDAILRAMRIHRDVAGVQEHACLVLRNLCASESNRLRVVMGGGIDDVILALTASWRCASSVQACAVLGDLAISTECHGALIQGGCVEAVVRAARTHASVKGLLEVATTLLSRLSAHTDALSRMQASGAADALSRLVAPHVKGVSEAVLRMRLQLLAKLREMEAQDAFVGARGRAELHEMQADVAPSRLHGNLSIQDHRSRLPPPPPPPPLPPPAGSALTLNPKLVGSPMVQVQGMWLYSGAFPQGVLWSGFNTSFARQDRLCNQRCVYQKVDSNGMWGNTAMWWGNNAGQLCWVIGPADAGASTLSRAPCACCPLGACRNASMLSERHAGSRSEPG